MEYRSAAAFDCSTWVATREQVEAELARLRAANARLREFVHAYDKYAEADIYAQPVLFHKLRQDLRTARRAVDEAGDLR